MKLANKCGLRQLASEMPVLDVLDQSAIFGGTNFDQFLMSLIRGEWDSVEGLGYIGVDGNYGGASTVNALEQRKQADFKPTLV